MTLREWKDLTLLIFLAAGISCSETPVGPEQPEDRAVMPRPQLTPAEWYQWCRLWTDGTVMAWVGPGSFWSGPCSTGITATPQPPRFYSNNPQPITLNFSGPVLEGVFSISPEYPNPIDWCPVDISWRAYDAANSIVAQGSMHFVCWGQPGGSGALQVMPLFTRLVLDPPTPVMPGANFLALQGDYFVPCPPQSDSLLDNPVMRDFLKAVWDSTVTTGPPQGHVERGGFLLRDGVTGQYSFDIRPIPADATHCSTTITPQQGGYGTREIIAVAHTHGFAGGELSACRSPTGRYDDVTCAGPSCSGDLTYATNAYLDPAVVGVYVMDKNYVYRIPRGTTVATAKTTVQAFPRSVGTCHLP